MKKIDFGQIINTLANLGVIGGLVFVGMQFQQDREISMMTRLQDLEINFYYWAELVNSNEDLWARGLAGEELSPGEVVAFNALAEAREFAMYRRWFSSDRSSASGTAASDSFMKEFAFKITRNPGLLAWWKGFYQKQIEIGRIRDFEESLNTMVESLLPGVDVK